MTDFTFSTTVPNAPNDPSVDQGPMLQNNISTNGILAVDHVTFNAVNGGSHLQTNFAQFSAGSLIAGTDSSVAFPAAGLQDTTHAQYYFKNPNATYLLNSIRAFVVFTVANATSPATIDNQYNISGPVTNATPGQYVVNLLSNVVASSSILVSITSNRLVTYSYNINGDGSQITIFPGGSAASFSFITNVIIMQA